EHSSLPALMFHFAEVLLSSRTAAPLIEVPLTLTPGFLDRQLVKNIEGFRGGRDAQGPRGKPRGWNRRTGSKAARSVRTSKRFSSWTGLQEGKASGRARRPGSQGGSVGDGDERIQSGAKRSHFEEFYGWTGLQEGRLGGGRDARGPRGGA